MDEITRLNFDAVSEALIDIRKKADMQHDIINGLRNTVVQLQQQISVLNVQNGRLLANNIGSGSTVL